MQSLRPNGQDCALYRLYCCLQLKDFDMSYKVVDRCSSEWSLMWAELSGIDINADEANPRACPNGNAQWAYTGTLVETDRNVHYFHHDCHPKTGVEADVKIIILH